MKTVLFEQHDREDLLDAIRGIIRDELNSKAMEPEEEWLVINDATIILKKAKQTIYQLCSAGKIPHYKRSGKNYFKRSELMEWLENGKWGTV